MIPSRRRFLSSTGASLAPGILRAWQRRTPNVIVLITDDQGYGDLSLHGNEHLKTPNLDAIGREGARFTQFHVSPVCAPTRSSLMTGRYNYRTGVVDTYLGRALMYPDEMTIAEMLGAAGYRTGIFGKWHLGDNYPLRSMDQGFQESLVHLGGGLSQPSDPPESHGYFDPVLQRNGKPERRRGYCTDIFMGAALDFIEQNRERPFFAYIALNAPHEPLEIDEKYATPYRGAGLDEKTARVYGMIANIDENTARLTAKLRSLGIERETLLVYLTDNGPQQRRYNAGMRGLKGSVYEGGIRVPCFFRWPGTIKPGTIVDRPAAHIDLLPTFLEVCGVSRPEGLKLDGRSLLSLALGRAVNWRDRTLFFQWHRGDAPELFHSCAARDQRHKLVDGRELYDLALDPGEQRNLAAERPEIVSLLRKKYEQWFADVSATRGYDPPRISIGTKFENPVTLSRQDWRGPRAGWTPDSLGYWEVDVAESGNYDVKLRMDGTDGARKAVFRLNGAEISTALPKDAVDCDFRGVRISSGKGRLEAWTDSGGKTAGVKYVRLDYRRVAG